MIQENFLFPKLKADTFNEVVTRIGNKMNSEGYVNDLYVNAVIKRERTSPTGLQIGNHVIAIPHAEQDYVNKPILSVATLKRPIKIYSMIQPEEELQANLIFLMAVKEPDKQVQMLSKLMATFQDEELLKELEVATSKNEMLKILGKTNLVTVNEGGS